MVFLVATWKKLYCATDETVISVHSSSEGRRKRTSTGIFIIFYLVRRSSMQKMECPCGYIYDPVEGDYEHGVAPGTPFAGLPDDWVCPTCGAEKEYFYAVD